MFKIDVHETPCGNLNHDNVFTADAHEMSQQQNKVALCLCDLNSETLKASNGNRTHDSTSALGFHTNNKATDTRRQSLSRNLSHSNMFTADLISRVWLPSVGCLHVFILSLPLHVIFVAVA